MAIRGGCRCGAVRYTVTAEPIATRVCWCRDCQYFAAGSATVNVIFPTPVTSASSARPHLLILRAGTLDDPGIAKPAMTIWTDSAPAWACIDAALPSNPRQPPPVA